MKLNGSGGPTGIFVVKGRTFTAEEVLQGAEFRGELEPCREELLTAVACARAAEERGLEPSSEALQTLSEEFRYERDLVTAEETERWLADRGLTLNDFHEFFIRRYWRMELQNPPQREPVDRLTAPPEFQNLLTAELTLSGEFSRMAVRLARRAAALAAMDPDTHARPVPLEEERARFLQRTGLGESELSEWLSRNGIGPSWFEELLRMEAVYGQRCATLLSPKARERVLQTLRLPLTRIEIETVELDSLDAAREAALCVSEDGAELAGLAEECRYPYRKKDVLLDELREELQRAFLTAAPGQVLDPIEDGERYLLCRLLGKIEPDLSDERIAGRVETQIIEAHFTDLTTKEIRWLIRDESAA